MSSVLRPGIFVLKKSFNNIFCLKISFPKRLMKRFPAIWDGVRIIAEVLVLLKLLFMLG